MSNIFEKLGIDISPQNEVAHAFFKSLITEYNKNVQKFDSPEVRNYFNNLTAAFMLEFNEAYENFDIKVPYRIKAPKSAFDKILEYLSRADKHQKVDEKDGNCKLELNEEIKDMFALTVVAGNTQPTLASKDPEISKLIREKKVNQIFLESMQDFRLGIIKDEFPGLEEEKYQYTASRKEYYYQSIMGIERIKSLVDPKAVNLLAKYDELLNKIKSEVPSGFFNRCMYLANECKAYQNVENMDSKRKLTELNTKFLSELDKQLTPEENEEMNKLITSKDTETVDFFGVINDFSARLDDKLNLAVLMKQVYSVFEHSQMLKRFGIELDTASMKEKRTPSGYVANFVYVNTPFGKVEMQLQTQHENLEGNYGYAAHTDMNGKKIKEFELPEPGDEQKLKEFQTCVDFISPRKFLAQFDNTEKNRVIIQKSGKYQNYKSIISQVKRGSSEDKRLTKYFAMLYPRRDEIFPNPDDEDKVESFIVYDIEEYLKSPEFKKLMEKTEKTGQEDEIRG